MVNITKIDIFERKLKTPQEIRNILDKNPNDVEYKVGLLGGCFDLTHGGHLELISASKDYEFLEKDKLGKEYKSYIDVIIIALNSDTSVKQLKGPTRPIVDQSDRAFLLASLEYVDFVTIFDEPVIDNVLKAIKPDFFIKSDQYSYETLTENERIIFKENDITPLFIPFYKSYSTTNIINLIKEK